MEPNIQRHPDGSIDFDYYRRRARRQRQLTRRLVFRRYLIALPMRASRLIMLAMARSVRQPSGIGDTALR